MNNLLDVKEKSKGHFNNIAENYNFSYDGKYVNCMYQEIVKRIITLKNAPTAILDLGCGNGNVTALLADNTEASLYGIDLSENMIIEAKNHLQEKAKFCIGDAEQLPYEDKMFDVVICNASFHHYPNPLLVLGEIKRVLNNDGLLILGDPTVSSKWFLKLFNWSLRYSTNGDYHIYGKKEIISMLQQEGFEVSDWKKINMRTFVLTAKLD